jgi:hypothetical protein
MDSYGGMILAGEDRKKSGKELSQCATLAITNPTWTDPGVNLSISYDSYILLIGSTYGYIKFCFRD